MNGRLKKMTGNIQPPHPFYPLEANVIGYLANDYSVIQLLGIFALTCVVLLGGSFLLVKRYGRRLTAKDEATVLWFTLCMRLAFSASPALILSGGAIHLFFEGSNFPIFADGIRLRSMSGYFAWNHSTMPKQQDLFGQLWKEYSHSDSRYMTSDPFVLCMETITAVWLPR